MRWKISPKISSRGHDPRQVDLVAVIALLIVVAASGWYLTTSFATSSSTIAFIEPSQSVRW
jgi:hypothetical protein